MNDLQKVILDIYKSVKLICDNNEIPYYAIGGTAIGAVRHNGFIPWDDDLDIAVPIEKFDFLISKLEKNLPDYYKVFDYRSSKYYPCMFIKVVDTRTTFIEKLDYTLPEAYKGVFIDIMPMSGVPSEAFMKKLYKYVQWNGVIRRAPISSRGIKKFAKIILGPLLSLVPRDYFIRKFYNSVKVFPLYKSDYTGYIWHRYFGKILMFPSIWFYETVEIPFEDTTMKCAKEYDKYLTYQFGDYMKLPSKDKRVNAHEGLIDLEKPFNYYKQHPEMVLKSVEKSE